MRQYPHFLEPHKRYITPTITVITERVLHQPRKLYAEAVKTDGPRKIPHFYGDSDCRLAPMSCWRWISWIALRLCKSLSSQPTVATEDSAQKFGDGESYFHPYQARSEGRFAELNAARRLILDQKLWPPRLPQQ